MHTGGEPQQQPIAGPIEPAEDLELAEPPLGDRLDAPGDTLAAEAVRQYLADLEDAHTQASEQVHVERQDRLVREREPATNVDDSASKHAAPVATEAAPTTSTALANSFLTIDEHPVRPITNDSTTVIPDHTAPASHQAPPRIVAVTLASDKSVPAESAGHAAAAVTNTGVSGVGTGNIATIDELIEQVSAELQKDPSDPRLQWRLSLLLLAAGRTVEAGDLSPELAERQRGLLAHQVALESAFVDLLADRADGANAAYAAAKALRDALRHDAELSLPMLALCSKVTTFGVYDVLPDSALVPYRANRAIVYCEVGNLAADSERSNHHRALLATRLELFAEDGRSLWTHEEPRIEDISRRRREDFFIAQIVTLPPTLGPGMYVLKATVTDLIADKTNETTREFYIGGDTALSAASKP